MFTWKREKKQYRNFKMKITFISTDNDVACHGVRSISAYIKLRGYETQIIFLRYGENINLNYDEKIIMQVIDKVKDSSIIAFSTMSFTAFRAYKLANALRKLKKPLVIGGIHATLLPEECLDFFDYVCVGEGEEAFLEFIQKFEKKQDLTNIRNLWTKKSQKIKKNEVRNLMESFDFIPDYDVESHFILENKTLVKFKERHFEGNSWFIPLEDVRILAHTAAIIFLLLCIKKKEEN